MSRARLSGPPFRTQVRVRYADTDAEGVVYYGSYLTYFEVARVELLRELGVPIMEARRRGVVFPAVAAQCNYRRPGRVDDLLEVRLWLGECRVSSFGFFYQVWRDDELVADGSTRHAAVDVAEGRAVRLPGWFVGLWKRAGRTVGSAERERRRERRTDHGASSPRRGRRHRGLRAARAR